MHTIHKKEFTKDMFSIESLSARELDIFEMYLDRMELLRKEFGEGKSKQAWRQIIQMLPSSFNQLRTVTLNYETLFGIYQSRKNHKLSEWQTVCQWIEELPHFKEICLE